MDHREAIRGMTAEKYVLGELEPDVRDAFEEHFFGCAECALEVRAAIALREHLRTGPSEAAAADASAAERRTWFWAPWFRPGWAIPVMTLLVAVVLYLGWIARSSPKDELASLRAPQILPSISLINVNTRGVDRPSVRIHAGQGFLLFVDLPPGENRHEYEAELTGPDGVRKWTLAIPSEAARDTLAIRAPAGLKAAGLYTLAVRSAGPNAVEVGRFPFELQLY